MRHEVRIDVDELTPWETGLEVFEGHGAYVRVVIDGIPDPVEGVVAAVAEDFVVLEHRDEEARRYGGRDLDPPRPDRDRHRPLPLLRPLPRRQEADR
jgi:hypothetical protein